MQHNIQSLYNVTSNKYDKRHDNATTRHLRKREMEAMKKHVKGLVLDIGCGTGVYTDVADDYVGIDTAKNMLEEARKKSNRVFVAASAEELPFGNETFDTAICMFTVLNLCDYKKAAREMRRVLKNGGFAVVSVASVWDRKNYRFLDKLRDTHDSDTKNIRIEKGKLKFRLFTKDELTKLFKKEEFDLTEFHGVYKWQEPYWNKYVKFSLLAKIKLLLERVLPSKTGRIFIAVFRKA